MEGTEAVVIFLELSNSETGCCVNFSYICPNVPKRLAKLIKDVTEYILTFLLKSKFTIKFKPFPKIKFALKG